MNSTDLDKITTLIEQGGDNHTIAALYVERGKTYQSLGKTMLAIDDFNEALRYDSTNVQAKSYIEYLYEILDYRYIQHYNV